MIRPVNGAIKYIQTRKLNPLLRLSMILLALGIIYEPALNNISDCYKVWNFFLRKKKD